MEMEVLLMQNQMSSEIISTEEYLFKRKEIRTREQKKEQQKEQRVQEKRAAIMLNEFYM